MPLIGRNTHLEQQLLKIARELQRDWAGVPGITLVGVRISEHPLVHVVRIKKPDEHEGAVKLVRRTFEKLGLPVVIQDHTKRDRPRKIS